MANFQYLMGFYKKAGEGLLTRICSGSTRNNRYKLKEERFRFNIGKKNRCEGDKTVEQVAKGD